MLRAAVPFVVGLALGRGVPPPLAPWWVLMLTIFGAWAVLSFRKQVFTLRWLPGVLLGVALLFFGVLWQVLHADRFREDHVGRLAAEAEGWEVRVVEVTSEKAHLVRAWAEVHSAMVDGKAVPARGGLLLTLLKDSTTAAVEPGDRLLLASRVEPIHRIPDPGGFDVRKWAASRRVFHESFAPVGSWRPFGRPAGGPDLFEQARRKIAQWLQASGLPERERALAKAILLGQRDEMERDQNMAFVRSGTIHVLAVSGTHMGIIYVAVLWGLLFLGKARRGRIIRGVVALVALWAYAGLTGFTPSVLRATVMFTLFTVAEMVRWRTDSLNSLAAAGVLLLLWDPDMLVQLGFQLSFLAVLGIAVFYRPLHLLWTPGNAPFRFLWSLVVVSLAAQAFTAPLCLYVFQAFPVWFLPANMVIVGLVGIGVYGGVALLVLHAVPVLGPFITVLMKWLLLALGFLSAFFAGLPGAYPAIRVGFWGMVGLYLLMAFGAAWLFQGHRMARLGTLACLAALLAGWAWTAHRRNEQSAFAVYSDRDGAGCAILRGRTLHVFTSGNGPRLAQCVEDHARSTGAVRVLVTGSLPTEVGLDGRSIILLPANARGHGSPETAILVLHGKGRVRIDNLSRPGLEQLVLAPDMDRGSRAWVRRQGLEAGIPVHDVRLAGAYVRP